MRWRAAGPIAMLCRGDVAAAYPAVDAEKPHASGPVLEYPLAGLGFDQARPAVVHCEGVSCGSWNRISEPDPD
jgi:hypothetical protein